MSDKPPGISDDAGRDDRTKKQTAMVLYAMDAAQAAALEVVRTASEKDHDVALEEVQEAAIRAARAAALNIDRKPFSEHAWSTLLAAIDTYIREIVRESNRLRKYAKSEQISKHNVESAQSALISQRPGKLSKVANAVGGFCLGTAGANLVAMLSANPINVTPLGVTITMALGVVGAGLVAWQLAKD